MTPAIEETMTPQQALSIVDQATSMLTLNRIDHIKIVTAIQVLNKEINKDLEAKPETEK